MIIILFATQLYIYKGSYVNTRPFIILLILLRRIILYISQKISSYLDQSSTAENGDIYCRKRVPISNILLSLYPYRSENVLLLDQSSTTENGDIYCRKRVPISNILLSLYLYKSENVPLWIGNYLFIGRKMSLYRSENVPL